MSQQYGNIYKIAYDNNGYPIMGAAIGCVDSSGVIYDTPMPDSSHAIAWATPDGYIYNSPSRTDPIGRITSDDEVECYPQGFENNYIYDVIGWIRGTEVYNDSGCQNLVGYSLRFGINSSPYIGNNSGHYVAAAFLLLGLWAPGSLLHEPKAYSDSDSSSSSSTEGKKSYFWIFVLIALAFCIYAYISLFLALRSSCLGMLLSNINTLL